MSEFNFQNFLGTNQSEVQQPVIETTTPAPLLNLAPSKKYFDLNEFIQEVYNSSEQKNKIMIQNQKYMSSYDVASSCIQNIIHKIRNTPIQNYANKWLPIVLRSYIGNSVHDFIQQNTNQFTEKEISIKIPSIRFSGRIDCLINNHTLVEIKSLPYSDYQKLLKTQTPRSNDFYQTLTYKYILENYLEESQTHSEQTRSPKPQHSNYNIQYIQYVYVAHDILASDIESLDEAIHMVSHVKKLLNSKHNTFYFMTNLVLDLKEYDLTDHINYIKSKIARVNYYLDNNLDVASDDEFIDTKACFFCLYPNICKFK